MGGGDGKGWTVCHSQGLKSEKGKTGWRKTRFIVFASLNLQPQHCKVHKKVAREGKRSITCWWNGLRDEKIERMPNPAVMGEEGAGAELRARRAGRRGQDDGRGGDQAGRTFPTAFMEPVPRHRDTRWISALRKSCRNPAGWDVLPEECSALVPFAFYCILTNYSFIPWPTASPLKNTFPVSFLRRLTLAETEQTISSVGERNDVLTCCVEQPEKADGSRYWSAFIWVAYFSESSPAWKQSLHVESLCCLSC